jgi:RNA polymerase sigma factor (sigma-70 family)
MVKDEEEKLSFYKRCKKIEQNFVETSKHFNIKELIIKININKEYIFHFIKNKTIQEIICSIKNSYRFNREEIENIIILVITEYFCEIKIDFDNFNQEKFLENFKKDISNKTKKMVRHSYFSQEMPLSGSNFYEDASILEDFRDIIDKSIDLNNALNSLSSRDRQIIEMRYFDNMTQEEIAEKFKLTKQRIGQILLESLIDLQDFLNN